MSEKNEDGLLPGQPVDFETMMKVKRQKKVEKDEPAKPKPTKKSKPSITNE